MNAIININSDMTANPTLERVAAILGISEQKLSEKIQQVGVPVTAMNVLALPEYAENEELAFFAVDEEPANFHKLGGKLRNNKRFLERLVSHNPLFFSFLSQSERSQKDFQEDALKGMVKQRRNFLEVETFLVEQISDEEERKALFDFYSEYLGKIGYIFRNDIEKYLFELREESQELYDSFQAQGFIERYEKTVRFSEKFWESLKHLFQSSQKEAEKDEIMTQIFGILGISDTQTQKKHKGLWDILYAQVYVEAQKQKIQESPTNNKEDTQQTEEENESQTRVEYALAHYISSPTFSGGYQIYYSGTKSIEMDEKEIQDITLVALENYMIFLRVFDELGLSFLSERYRDQFLHIGGFHYDSGEGITQARLLRLLNIVGKNIGVPEKNYEDEQGNKKVGCFETLAGAKLAFRYIKETGNINDTFVCAPSERGDYAITEIYLIQNGYIDREGRGLNISRWH